MPDKKISQLTGGGAAAASDKFVVARGTANFSIEGTAVAAAATSVGTLTSLAVSGNLTVDTNTLFVEATNNRVGIGTVSPLDTLEVLVGFISASDAKKQRVRLRMDSDVARVDATFYSGASGAYTPLAFSTADVERMRLDTSGNLGLGTASPATRLDVNGATTLRGNVTFVADATYDIGASGATRPRDVFVGRRAVIDGITVGRGGATAVSTNTAVGASALNSGSLTGGSNTAVGSFALNANSTGAANTAVGDNALLFNNTGGNNSAVGQGALFANTTGSSNSAVGYNALLANSTGSFNTAVGRSALGANTAADNTAVGYFALTANTTAANNTAVGVSALAANMTGGFNTATGSQALYSNTGGQSNTANGANSLYSTTGGNNTGVGQAALYLNNTGANNTAVGRTAGYGDGTLANTTGTNNTFLGYEAMGASATASNVITLGNASIATLRCQVTTITSLSDARDKTDIAPIPAGLAFVNALNPVSFVWNTRDGGKVGVPEFGFIAQELQAAQTEQGVTVPNLVSTENPDKLEASAGTLIPVLVKAIHELTARIAALEAK